MIKVNYYPCGKIYDVECSLDDYNRYSPASQTLQDYGYFGTNERAIYGPRGSETYIRSVWNSCNTVDVHHLAFVFNAGDIYNPLYNREYITFDEASECALNIARMASGELDAPKGIVYAPYMPLMTGVIAGTGGISIIQQQGRALRATPAATTQII